MRWSTRIKPVCWAAPPKRSASGSVNLVARFGFRSPSEASNALITAKRMFVRLLRGVIGEYALDESEAEAEIEEFRAILRNAR